MPLLLIAGLAAAATTARPLMPAEKAVIADAIASFLPNRPQIATDPVKPDAVIVCGRVNGKSFKVAIHRNAAGRITRADEAVVWDKDDSALLRMNMLGICLDNGYATLF